MKNTIILLSLFILLGGGTYFYLNHTPKKASSKRLGMNFHVDDVKSIHKIFLADRSGKKVILERKEDYWLYNGKVKARPNAVDNLLDAIKRVRMKYIPPAAAVPNAVKTLGASGIKVELYDKENQPIKVYYVGGMTSDERGTYMIMENSEQPYVTYIPSWEGGLRARYWFRNMDWEDRAIFSYKPDEIKAISVEYPQQKSLSFKLEKKGRAFEITPFYDITPKITRPYKKGSAEQYILGFRSMAAESILRNASEKDSIVQLVPFSIVRVTDHKNQEFTVHFHPQTPEGAKGPTIDGITPATTSIFRYFANCSNGNFMLVQNRVFKNAFWSYESFFE